MQDPKQDLSVSHSGGASKTPTQDLDTKTLRGNSKSHKAKCAVNMHLFDSWHRKYQVAENRTHPEMTTYPPTGYVLTGISVVPPRPREPPIPPRAASGLGAGPS